MKPVIIYVRGATGESPQVVRKALAEMGTLDLETLREACLMIEYESKLEQDEETAVAYRELRYRIEVEVYRRNTGHSTIHTN